MKVKLELNIDTADHFDMNDIANEIKKQCVTQILSHVTLGTIDDLIKVFNSQLIGDKKIKELMEVRKQQIIKMLKDEIENEKVQE